MKLTPLEPLPDALAQTIHATIARVEEPGAFQAFIYGDPCLDNALVRGSDLLLIDFEMGRPGHALLDAVYLLSPFPTCDCAGHLPNELAFALLETYRTELGRFTPTANDLAAFNAAVVCASTPHACSSICAAAGPKPARSRATRPSSTARDDPSTAASTRTPRAQYYSLVGNTRVAVCRATGQ